MADFAQKLTLTLKALSLSRARLAADMGVDKSVVARWASGATQPSTHNLALLTGVIARKAPGFTALDWDRDLPHLATCLGVTLHQAPADAESKARPEALPLAFLDQARATTALRGRAYEGFYRSTRPYPGRTGTYIHDQCLVRLADNGLLRLRMATDGVLVDGWALLIGSQVFVIGSEFTSGSMVFALLHGANAVSVGLLDGITLFGSLDAGRTPTATPIVLQRTEKLSRDPTADDARLEELAADEPIAPGDTIPETLRRHLARDVGGEWVLCLPLALSLSQGEPGPTF
jgi:transcriptional regulator with XRE-family HTH domain